VQHIGTDLLRELWDYRELLYFLAWRDIKVRYKQTVLGAAWAILQPTLTMLVFSIFFGRLARVPSDGVPYPLFALCGLVPWQIFAFGLTSSANSLVSNERLVTRVYFPRLVVPVASVLAGTLDFAVALPALVVALFWYGVPPTVAICAAPVLVALAVAASVAVGVGLSALNVRYRDVRHALPFVSQLWMFLTPIAYPASLVPERWQLLYGLNPMVGVVEGFRWALLGSRPFPAGVLGAALVSTLAGLCVSVLYFRRVERSFADVI
jgi:lipopolysaccharide transport system permease protein